MTKIEQRKPEPVAYAELGSGTDAELESGTIVEFKWGTNAKKRSGSKGVLPRISRDHMEML